MAPPVIGTSSIDRSAEPAWFGPYRVLSALATGGMGVLYRAAHRDTGAAVAIKTVVSPKEGVLGSIRSEIRALARLEHRGVARIVDEGVEGGHPWYAMELVEGKTLARWRDELWHGQTSADLATHIESTSTRPRRDGETPVPIMSRTTIPRAPAAAGHLVEVLTTIEALCAPLAYIHGRGIVHRDLKPENVLRKPDGTPVLIDFGVAARFPATDGREVLEASGSLAGTMAYIAPEQFRRSFVDARADLYSLGCMLYEFVCGRRPFLGNSSRQLGEAHLHEPPVPPSRIVDGVPSALEALILRLLAKRPRDRIGYAADVADAIAMILEDLRPGARPRRSSGQSDSGDFYLYRPEMTGRKEPADRLLAAAEAARRQRGGVFYLGGESGVGKTMLAGEIGKQAAVLGIRVVTGDCVMYGEATPQRGAQSPLGPFRGLLQAVADHCRTRGATTTGRLFGARAPLLASIEPTLVDLPGLEPGPPQNSLTGEAARSAILTAVKDLLVLFCQEQPLLLVIDDVQWADELSLAVLRLLSPALLEKLPLLIVATYRSDEAPASLRALTTTAGAHDLRLARLDEDGVAAMVTEMLGTSRLPAAMIGFLARTSEGNPFFVAEYVRAAVTLGVLKRQRGQWQLDQGDDRDAAYAALPLPSSLRGLIQRRLQGLADTTLRLLEAAAVIGRVVDPAVLAATVGGEPALVDDALADLVTRHVLEEHAGGFRFVHEKLREHATGGMSALRRQELHLAVAHALEAAAPREAPALAFHFEAGGRPERAFHYASLAGQRALTAGALHDAHDQFGKALRLEQAAIAHAPSEHGPIERARLRRWVGEARAAIGDLEGSDQVLREAYQLIHARELPRTSAGWAGFVLLQLAIQTAHRFRQPHARSDAAERAALEEAATVANRLGFVAMVQGATLPMLGVLTLAANLAERAEAPAPRGIPYSILASVFGLIGMRQISRRYFTLSRQAVADAGDAVAPLQQAQIEGFYYLNQGDWAAAREVLESAFARGQALRIPYEIEALGIARAWLEMMLGRLPEARGLLGEVRRTAETLGNRLHEWWARRYEALVLLQGGHPREALAISAPAEAGFRAQGGPVDLLNLLAVRAIAHQRLGENDEALALAKEAQALAIKHPNALWHCFELHAFLPDVFLRAWIRANEAAGDQPASEAASLERAARASLRSAARYARTFRIGLPSVLLNRSRLARIEGKSTRADQMLKRAKAVAAELHMSIDGMLSEDEAAKAP